MKIGKQPKRLGGPSAKFLARKAAQMEADAQTVPGSGKVPLYLDDERACPKGWVLVRSPRALFDLIEGADAIADRITHLSLDWHLGTGIMNGEGVADWLAERFHTNPDFLPRLEAVGLHSSDREKAMKMLHKLREAIPEERWYDLMIDTRTPSL